MSITKKILSRLGIAGIIILLLWGGYQYFFHSNTIKNHFKKAVEYTNQFKFDDALAEINDILSSDEASPEDKQMAQLMQKIIHQLQNNPHNQTLMDQLNKLALASKMFSSKELKKIQKNAQNSPNKKWAQEKADILQQLNSIEKENKRNMSVQERIALEKTHLELLTKLKNVMDKETPQSGKIIDPTITHTKQVIKDLESILKKQEEALLEREKALKQQKLNSLLYKKKLAQLRRAKRALARKKILAEKQIREKMRLAKLKRQQALKQQELERQKQQALKQQELERQKQQALKQQELERQKQQALKQQELERQKQQAKNNRIMKIKQLKTKAVKQFALENYSKANEFYNQVLTLTPQDAESYAMKSIIALRQNDTQNSQIYLNKALQNDKGEFQVPLAQAEQAYKNKNLEQAFAYYSQSIQRKPNSLSYYRQGTIDLKQKNFQAAIEHYDNSYYSPDKNYLEKNIHTNLSYNKGKTHENMKQYSQAIKLYNEAIKYTPSYMNANLALAQLYYKQKKYKSSISILSAFYRYQPKNKNALILLGKNYHKLNNFIQAENYFQKAATNYPNNSTILYNLGLEQTINKKYPLAISTLKKALSIKPTASAYTQLGIAYLKNKQYNDAKAQFTQSLIVKPNNIASLKGLAEIAVKQLQFVQAKQYLEKGKALNPNDSEIWLKLGFIAFKKKNISEAITNLKKAFELNHSPDTQGKLASTYLYNKQFDLANINYTQAFTKTKNPYFLEGKANVQIAQKNYPLAYKILNDLKAQYPNYNYIQRVNQKIMTINKLRNLKKRKQVA